MLRKIIFSGNKQGDRFVLTEFPEEIEEAQIFERDCSRLSAIIYTTSDDPSVELKNELTKFNLDSLYQKKFKLRNLTAWDSRQFNELLGDKIDYSVALGRQLSGKSTVCQILKDHCNFHVFDMRKIEAELKKRMATEEGEPEEIPYEFIAKEIITLVRTNKAAGKRVKYIFDGFISRSPGVQSFASRTRAPRLLRQVWRRFREDQTKIQNKE